MAELVYRDSLENCRLLQVRGFESYSLRNNQEEWWYTHLCRHRKMDDFFPQVHVGMLFSGMEEHETICRFESYLDYGVPN